MGTSIRISDRSNRMHGPKFVALCRALSHSPGKQGVENGVDVSAEPPARSYGPSADAAPEGPTAHPPARGGRRLVRCLPAWLRIGSSRPWPLPPTIAG